MVGVVSAARADDQGPVVVGSTPTAPLLGIKPPTGNLSFDYVYERDTVNQEGTSTATTDNRAQETLNLLTEAYVLNPGFIDVSMGGLIGQQQESFDEPGDRRYTDTTLDGWDVTGNIRRDSDTPVSIYTRRSQQIVTPDFSPSLTSTDTTYGASLDIQSNFAPTQFQIYHEDDKQTEAGGFLEYELTQDVIHWHTDVIGLQQQTLTWDFNYQNDTEKEDNTSAVHYEDYDASLIHTLNFGAGNVNSLTSSASVDDQIGDLGYDEYRLDENMQLQHTPTFQTHYDYSLDYTSIDQVDQINHKLDVGFIHHLFESLTTTGDAGGALFNETGGTDVQQLFGSLGFGYRKDVPFGLLLSNLNLAYNYVKSEEGDEVTHVVNQVFTFTDTQPLVLTQTNVDPKSIQVLSADGVPYLKGSDFVVHQSGNLIQVERVVGGLIPPDSTVKLDYNLLPEPSNTTNTETLGSEIRYQIEDGPLTGLAPYVRYGLQRQFISNEGSYALVPDSYDDLVVGSDYKIWKLTFNAEQQWHDSTLVPFDATRGSARYTDQLSRDTTASIAAAYALIDYYGEDDLVSDTSITAAAQKKLTTQWSITARAVYLNDRDQLFGNTYGLEEQLEVDWQRNQTQVFARVRNATLNTDFQNTTFQVLEFGISRSF
jgi:hypothetical protein